MFTLKGARFIYVCSQQHICIHVYIRALHTHMHVEYSYVHVQRGPAEFPVNVNGPMSGPFSSQLPRHRAEFYLK